MKDKNIEDVYKLSPMQQGMLFHTLYAPKSEVYFEQVSFTLHGDLDLSAFRRAWQQVVDRHTVLRTSFFWEDLDELLQVVHQRVKLPLEQHDWRGLSSSAQEGRLETYRKADRRRGFELSEAPLMRLALIRVAEDAYQLIWSFHHLLLDGWSVSLLLKEVFAFYDAFCRGQDIHLERTRPYRDYIVWLRQQDLSKAEAFWRRALKGFTAPTSLRGDRSASSLSSQEEDYDEHQIQLSMAATAALQSLARKHHLTLNTLVQGAWALLLSRYSGEEDVVFGAVVAGRPTTLAGVESMVGLLINTLPVRVQVSPEAFLVPWLTKLQAQQAELRQYEYSPLLQVQGWSDVPGGLPLLESVVVFENYPLDAAVRERGGSLQIHEVRAVTGRTNYPLTVLGLPGPELSLQIVYDSRRFTTAMLTQMLGHLKTLLEGMVTNPEQRLSDLPLLGEAERQRLLVEWNGTQAEYPQARCIHQLFEVQVERTPDAIAVVCEEEQLTYRELNRRANQLARHLQALGVGTEVHVGIYLERSVAMLVGLLGVLKAGGAYVPLDPAYPQERLAFMLEDAKVPVLLTQQWLVGGLPEHRGRVVCLDTDWEAIAGEREGTPDSAVTADNLAYVIYTSGSTGIPKGVLGLHRGAVNRFRWMWKMFPFEPEKIACQKTSLSFVDSVWEIFGPLLQGIRTVVMPDAALKDPHGLVQTLAVAQVTRIVLVPSLLQVILDPHTDLQSRLPRLKYWVTSGEALSLELSQRFLERMSQSLLINLYGSSEVSADATWYDTRQSKSVPCVPIGRPIANTQIYLLDASLQPVPIGVPGELHVGGAGLARGYLNRPELTAEKLIANPLSDEPGTRLYKTGDLARYLPDGAIEFLGRLDHQVKIRGFRIELGEIEAVLRQHPAIREGVVVAREEVPGDKRLVAYVVTNALQASTISELRGFLREHLPDYMVPSTFVTLDALPLTPNGKVDRRRLPAPELARAELGGTFVAPGTPLESLIAEVWQDVLGVDRVGVHDNFFDLGGHSLLSIQVMTRLEKHLGLRINPGELVFQTLGQLASACEKRMHPLQSSESMSLTQKFFHALKGAVSHKTGDRN